MLHDKINPEQSGTKRNCIVRYIQFILNPRAGVVLPYLFLGCLIFFQAIKSAMTFMTLKTSTLNSWQVSGYYLSAVEYGLLLFITISWLVSILIFLFSRQYERGLKRILAIPLIFICASIVNLISRMFLPSMISGWPIDAVYSETRQKHFVLAHEPAFTDVCYRIFSTNRSLLNPIWTVEFAHKTLDYSEDGSLIKNPYLVLSKDEEMLVVSRGGHFTDAILIDSKQPLISFIPWCEENREKQWEQRTNQIKSLLQQHSIKSESNELQDPLTYPQIRAILKEYYQKLEKELTEHFENDGWVISCELSEVDQVGIKVNAHYTVKCSKETQWSTFPRGMRLVDDNGRLVIVEHDNLLSWSDDEEKALCENIRDVITNLLEPGTYIN